MDVKEQKIKLTDQEAENILAVMEGKNVPHLDIVDAMYQRELLTYYDGYLITNDGFCAIASRLLERINSPKETATIAYKRKRIIQLYAQSCFGLKEYALGMLDEVARLSAENAALMKQSNK